MRNLIFVFALALASCSDHPAGQQSLFDLSIDYRIDGGDDTYRGTLFEYRKGDLTCSAGFVYALQSRIYSNSNDLEFWCRHRGDVSVGRFESLPEDEATSTQSRIANINGELFDYDAQDVFDWTSAKWKPAPLPTHFAFAVQRVGGDVVTAGYRPDCAGLSIWFGSDYAGTIDTGSSGYSAVHVSEGQVLINMDGAVLSGALVKGAKSCSHLTMEKVLDGNEYIYGFWRSSKGRLLFGGSTPGYGANGKCAAFYRDVEQLSFDCSAGRIKEYYSYTPTQGGLLIGNFPLGTLLKYSGGQLAKTTLGAPESRDWKDPSGPYYRESQSIVSTSGYVLIGMYPWGEVILEDGLSGGSQRRRLFSAPLKSPASPTPFFQDAYAYAQQFSARDEKAELVYSLVDGPRLRREGIEPIAWGQRVSNIAVFNGKVCASTGNATRSAYDPRKHAYLSDHLAQMYGRVFCADLENQTMTTGPVAMNGHARFIITPASMRVDIDGKTVAETPHHLAPRDLAALSGGMVTLGDGSYGKIRGIANVVRQ